MDDIFTDKLQEYANDAVEYGVMSNCCDAPIVMGDICTACKEHCDPIEEEEED